ncbi:DUF6095 family protein [Lutibacter sp.]|uniref:DUF6095 family protein n=1 Tax=Lutibacter sp. TaxID=1925666 RepID=UPI0027325D82|nr:DUF6095 family protein [Lutibacter sp.]MDP3314208.1 DUF6095 family protein [Lutibacter sp.]
MSTDRNELYRGLKYALITLPLLLISPVLITIGLKAIKAQQHYLWITIGCILAIISMYLGYTSIRIILNAFFSKKK